MTTVRGRLGGLGGALLLLLLVASVGAAAYVYHARTPDLALQAKLLDRKFAPSANGEGQRSRIAYFVRFNEPHATIELVGRDKTLVRTIGDDVPLRKDDRQLYRWNGLDDEGELAAPGAYRLRVILAGHDRDMIFPRRITVEPEPFEPEKRSAGKDG
ncbi:hypothetical protein BH10ACT11_BH10ACT11_05780 [soil metagenome]